MSVKKRIDSGLKDIAQQVPDTAPNEQGQSKDERACPGFHKVYRDAKQRAYPVNKQGNQSGCQETANKGGDAGASERPGDMHYF